MVIKAIKKVQLGEINVSVEIQIEDIATEEERLFAGFQIASLQTSNMVEESSTGVTLQ